jgi:hypothetical protein
MSNDIQESQAIAHVSAESGEHYDSSFVERIDQSIFCWRRITDLYYGQTVKFFENFRGDEAWRDGSCLTNLWEANRLYSKHAFLVEAIKLDVAGASDAVQDVMLTGIFEMMIGDKTYLEEGPLHVFVERDGRRLSVPLLLLGGQTFGAAVRLPEIGPRNKTGVVSEGYTWLGVQLRGRFYRSAQ